MVKGGAQRIGEISAEEGGEIRTFGTKAKDGKKQNY